MIRNPWKGIFVLPAIWAMTVVGHGSAQEHTASPDGLYAVPDAAEGAAEARDSTSNRSAQSYLNSLDLQGEQLKRDQEKAESMRKALLAAKKLRASGAGGDFKFKWLTWRPNLSEQTWIAILAAVGLLVPLAAGAFVWWSRHRYAKSNRAVLLALKREPAAKPDGFERRDKPSKRRAA